MSKKPRRSRRRPLAALIASSPGDIVSSIFPAIPGDREVKLLHLNPMVNASPFEYALVQLARLHRANLKHPSWPMLGTWTGWRRSEHFLLTTLSQRLRSGELIDESDRLRFAGAIDSVVNDPEIGPILGRAKKERPTAMALEYYLRKALAGNGASAAALKQTALNWSRSEATIKDAYGNAREAVCGMVEAEAARHVGKFMVGMKNDDGGAACMLWDRESVLRAILLNVEGLRIKLLGREK